MTDTDFTGVFPATVTPFHPDGRIDFETLRTDARRLEAAGVDGLVPVGSTGESATLTHDEHVAVVEAVADAVDVPVVAGAGSNATREALSLSRRAVDAGADALLHISPYYNCPEPEGMVDHYRTVADAVDVPQILYNVPGRTGRSIDIETVVELASHENVRGYKAASGDLERVSELVERTRDEEFSVLSGDDGLTLPTLSLGGTGAISVVANVEPELTVAMVRAGLDGDFERARELHHRLAPLVRQLFVETNPIPVKEALSTRGHVRPTLRAPLSRLSPDRRGALREALAALDDGGDDAGPDARTGPEVVSG
jgi:4-hydroxy-tetrahydrodipicolinate synthase